MAIESLETVLFLEPSSTKEVVLRQARVLLERAGALSAGPLVPLDGEQRRILESSDANSFETSGKILFFNNQKLCEAVDPDWMLQLVLSDEDAPAGAYLNLTPVPSGSDHVEPNWSYIVDLLAVAVEIYRPTLAMCNGVSTDESIDPLPSFEELKPGRFPPMVTPWTYVGPQRLDEDVKQKLAKLDVFRSEPLGDGWLIQVVEHYYDKPARATLTALRALSSSHPKYLHTRP